ncbi:hypothetical protein EDC01DRAFT_632948 [Geopyxis carbonaria]|nr:hypothetical protein EDC01DRAFT_632948 [Geopyxis carbonaria]
MEVDPARRPLPPLPPPPPEAATRPSSISSSIYSTASSSTSTSSTASSNASKPLPYPGLEVVPAEHLESFPQHYWTPEQLAARRDSRLAPQVCLGSAPEFVNFAHLNEKHRAQQRAEPRLCGVRRKVWFWAAVGITLVGTIVAGVCGGVIAARRHSPVPMPSGLNATSTSTAASTSLPASLMTASATSPPSSVSATTTTSSSATKVYTDFVTPTAICTWDGHCAGAKCTDLNDCASPNPCVDGVCMAQTCNDPGRWWCIGHPCALDTQCADGLTCDMVKGACYDPREGDGFVGNVTGGIGPPTRLLF